MTKKFMPLTLIFNSKNLMTFTFIINSKFILILLIALIAFICLSFILTLLIIKSTDREKIPLMGEFFSKILYKPENKK